MAHWLRAFALTLAFSAWAHVYAASVTDLIGMWTVDGDATWQRLQHSPQIASKLTGLPAEMVDQIKSAMLTQINATSFQFTSDKLISTTNGLRREERFTISATNGNVLTADCIDDQGKASQSTVTVGKDQLEISNVADATQVVVLKRAK